MAHVQDKRFFPINSWGADRCCQTLLHKIKGNAVLILENDFGAVLRRCICPLPNSLGGVRFDVPNLCCFIQH